MPRGIPKNGANPGWFKPGSGQAKTADHKRNIGDGQRRAWQKKRRRLPVGSKNIDSKGYVRVKVTEGSGVWAQEHILVAAEKLGRPINKGEIVHHVDMHPSNNEPGNLHVCDTLQQHAEIHRSLNDLVAGLIEDGIIAFDCSAGKYVRR
jgi:hypothetical protein